MSSKLLLLLFVGGALLSACRPANLPVARSGAGEGAATAPADRPTEGGLPGGAPTTAPAAIALPVVGAARQADGGPAGMAAPAPTGVPRSEADWRSWPELPEVPAGLREAYLRGIEQGSNPHAFSILGDCQSQPDVFMGVFDSQPEEVKSLPPALQETVAYFAGSFDRYSPTVKDATTEGALLWAQWNDNKEKKCKPGETPLDCELRTHRPSIVFIHIGTHWEARNRQYLNTIIDKIFTSGAVPVLVTKADNREKDERVNKNLASLAVERGLPLWNFWASVQHLPDNGLKADSDMYLNDEAVEIHRMGAIRALDAVWRAVR